MNQAPRQTRLVLVVEDEQPNLKLFETILKCAGYQVRTATDGVKGLEAMRETPHPDLVLLNRLMPRMDGMEVLEHMAQDPNLSRLPVIMVSAFGSDEEKQRAMKLGAKATVDKVGSNCLQRLMDTIYSVLGEA
jgi:CheY-like chemotaxis protein